MTERKALPGLNSPRLCGQYKKAPNVGERELCNRLTSLFEWRQFCFELNSLVIVKVYEVVNEASSLFEGGDLHPMDTLRFENGKEVFS